MFNVLLLKTSYCLENVEIDIHLSPECCQYSNQLSPAGSGYCCSPLAHHQVVVGPTQRHNFVLSTPRAIITKSAKNVSNIC